MTHPEIGHDATAATDAIQQAQTMLAHQLQLRCVEAFEDQLKSEGENVSIDATGQYENILHRSKWRTWQQGWSASQGLPPPTEIQLYAPISKNDVVMNFLSNCKVAGVFFDGYDASNTKGLFFLSLRQIEKLTSTVGRG